MDGFFIVDEEGYFREVNPAYCHLVGYSREELLTMSIPDIEARETPARTRDHIGEIIASGKARFETAHRHKDGYLIEVEVSVTFLSLETDRYLLSFIRDLTDVKDRDRRLQAREEELRQNYDTQFAVNALLQLSLQNISLDGILSRALDLILSIPWLSFESRGSIFLVEEGHRVLVMQVQRGIPEPLLRGCERVPFGKCLCGQAASTGELQYANCLDSRHEVRYEGIHPHGHYCVPITISGKVLGVINLYLREGHPSAQKENEFLTAIANSLAGILIRKRTEEENRKLNQDLERRVRERTAELEKANKELEAFSYSVSHDLRTPLIAMSGLSRLLLEKYANRLDTKGQEFLNMIRRKTDQMVQIIDNLLSLSHVDQADMTLSNVDMKELLEEVFQELMSISAGRTIDLKIGAVPSAYADRSMIRQVLSNLLSNAVKYTKNKTPAAVEVGGRTENAQNVYYVRDNGVGFDMQFAPRLFDVFHRLHPQAEFEGSGIGLAIVQRIIQRHGGQVWAEGEAGKGATFYFTLPIRPQE